MPTPFPLHVLCFPLTLFYCMMLNFQTVGSSLSNIWVFVLLESFLHFNYNKLAGTSSARLQIIAIKGSLAG